MAQMSEVEMQAVVAVREAVQVLNKALEQAHGFGLQCSLNIGEMGFVGARTKLLSVHGSVVRCTYDIDERI